MKAIFTLLAIFITAFASAQVCNSDGSNAEGIRPSSSSVPCVTQGVAFNQTYTVVLPTSTIRINGNDLTLQQAQILSLSGLPNGLTASFLDPLPKIYQEGEKFCFKVSGTTTALCGQYKLELSVKVFVGFELPLDDLSYIENQGYAPLFIRVIGPGDACPTINENQTANFEASGICGSISPILSTDAATNIGTGNAQFNGTVDAEGLDCTVQFEWGETTNYDKIRDATPDEVSGTNPTSVSSAVFGLDNNTTYHYRLKVTYQGGVVYGDDRSFTTGTSTGINETSNLNINVYPNPAHNDLTVETSSSVEGTLILSNLLGASVLTVPSTAATTKLDVSHVPAGVYTLTFITAGKTSTTRIAIEK